VTGPAHYREAERLLAASQGASSDTGRELVWAAQVHATLALTAATALGGVTLPLPVSSDLAAEWNQAIGVTQ